MAALMIFEVPTMTLDDYDRLFEAMGIRSDADRPDGMISHVAGTTGEGLLTAGVWESMPQLDRFYADLLGPGLAQERLPQALPRLLPVHNLIRRGAGETAGVIMLIEVPGFDVGAYDLLVAGIDAHAGDGSNHPAFSHVAAQTPDGIVVVDVWDSAESFGRFAEEQLAPSAEAAGLPPLEPRFVPVHNHIEAPAAVA
jgi:hypothetical protein